MGDQQQGDCYVAKPFSILKALIVLAMAMNAASSNSGGCGGSGGGGGRGGGGGGGKGSVAITRRGGNSPADRARRGGNLNNPGKIPRKW